MYRLDQKTLFEWLKSPRRKPLLLRGARQVGKSTLVRMFADANELDLLEINLERHLYLNDVFKTLDIPLILRNLLSITGKPCTAKSLIFLDEIQATPNAIAALRYFYEDKPELPVIATGSLLEFALSDHEFSMPVGRVQTLHLGPVIFEEMLLEVAPHLLESLKNMELGKPLPEATRRPLPVGRHSACSYLDRWRL